MSGSDNNLIRLNKFLAQCGLASRRAADRLISSGAVAVNGRQVTGMGVKIDPAVDRVEVNGSRVEPPREAGGLYLILNKPVRVLTTAKDPRGRDTVMDLLPPEIRRRRPFPAGRLDYFSSGLLLMTTDGELCRRMTHPKWHLPKVYRVLVREQATEGQLKAMRSGMTLAEGEVLAPVRARVLKPGPGCVLELTLIQGVNRQIRRMCRDLGLTVLGLERVSIGPLSLAGLSAGKWRGLTDREVRDLKTALGLQGPLVRPG